jgi:AraC-like DNA-binding protein
MPSPQPSRHISLSNSKGSAAHGCEIIAIGRGYQIDSKRYAFDNRHREKFSLLQYTLEGSGRFRAGPRSSEMALPAPRAFLVNCPSPTSYWLPEGGSWEFVYLIFGGELAAWHVAQLNASHGYVFDLPLSSTAVGLLQGTYQEAADRRPLDQYILSSRLYQILMDIYRLQKVTSAIAPNLEHATRFIEQEYANPALTVHDIAHQAGLSSFHFARLFRQQLGVSPNVFLTQVRMNHARNLLMFTQFPIKQIAHLVGFSDSSYFCKIYRRHHRHSPGSIRRI